jgi:4'-phosphopantetheinyl transferase
MNDFYGIKNQTVHIWPIVLTDFIAEKQVLFNLLSEDEAARALRFHLPLHRQRYVITRGLLRRLLSLYTDIPPGEIIFSYGPKGKPYLDNNNLNLQFNLSHSDEQAIYAFALDQEIGIDIQKINANFNIAVVKRLFSANEITELLALPLQEQSFGFYHIWTRKEAIIKTIGSSVFSSPADFSVSLEKPDQPIQLALPTGDYYFYLKNISIQNNQDYCAAVSACTPLDIIVKQL